MARAGITLKVHALGAAREGAQFGKLFTPSGIQHRRSSLKICNPPGVYHFDAVVKLEPSGQKVDRLPMVTPIDTRAQPVPATPQRDWKRPGDSEDRAFTNSGFVRISQDFRPDWAHSGVEIDVVGRRRRWALPQAGGHLFMSILVDQLTAGSWHNSYRNDLSEACV